MNNKIQFALFMLIIVVLSVGIGIGIAEYHYRTTIELQHILIDTQNRVIDWLKGHCL